jgi:predicted kinase
MNKLLILQGIPASGKSFFAKQWVEEDPKTRVIVNRDSIRRGLGVYWVPSREGLVTSIEQHSVWEALEMGYDVCLDATNLNSKYLEKWEEIAFTLNIPIKYKVFDISLKEAIERDKNREFPVGEKVINQFYNKYCI